MVDNYVKVDLSLGVATIKRCTPFYYTTYLAASPPGYYGCRWGIAVSHKLNMGSMDFYPFVTKPTKWQLRSLKRKYRK